MTVPPKRIAALQWCINLDNVVFGPREATYTDASIAQLKAMGTTGVRIPVECGGVVVGIPRWNQGIISDAAYVAHNQPRLAAVVDMCLKHGLGIVLCPFTNPAMFARGADQMLADVLAVQTYLTTTYGAHEEVMFELLNEPHGLTPDVWNTWVPKIADRIGKHAPSSTKIIPPAGFSVPTNFHALTPIPGNVVYTFHMYHPSGVAGQFCLPGTLYPKAAGDTVPAHNDNTTAKTRAYMQHAADFAKANNAFMWMGEYGCGRKPNLVDPPSRENWMTDVQQAAKDMGFGLCYWAYDGRKFGLNPHEKGMDPMLQRMLTR